MTAGQDEMNSNDPTTSHHQNPYESPTTQSFDDGFSADPDGFSADPDDFEQMRWYHLSHEASIRSFGLLYWFGGGVMLFLGGAMIVQSLMEILGQRQIGFPFEIIMISAVYIVVGLLQITVARGIRKFTPIGKIGGIIFGMIGLIGFPIGTLLSGYMLYLLLSAKGKFIFSPQYQQVLKATPHIVYKNRIVLLLLIIVVLIVIVALFASIL